MPDRVNRNPAPVVPTTTPNRPTTPQAPSTPTTPANTGWAPKSNDKVLFVAMNNSDAHRSTLESDALKARGTNVTVIQDAKKDDQITTRDASGALKTHDLASQDGAMSFALTLGLPAEQTKKIADVLVNAGSDSRDELAQLAQQWAVAEKGGQAPSRLVLSGHHVGSGVYGENNGRLDWPTVGALAEAMPRGAKTVEDLLIAGCYSGGENMMEKYTGMFPNAKTIVAYDGSSPGAASGATAHQKAWEQATRGTSEGIKRELFQGMRKGENVTVWTKTRGFDDGKPKASVDELKQRRANLEQGFKDAWEGAPIPDTQRGPVRDYYNATQRLIQHPGISADERKGLEHQRDQTIRLIFYGPVSSKFQEVHGQKAAAGYQALGMAPPNFKTMTRAQALASIREFEAKLAGTPNAGDAATKLAPMLRDFAELKPSLIPDTWV
ncbi:MAG: hypothetical protein JNJ54_22175 [Myxococcaceae bacterium]|nr:hypothetical protein [Myxococcaceae bacterium]